MTQGRAPKRGELIDRFKHSNPGRGGSTDPGNRVSRDRTLLGVASVISQRSTCSRASVGAVIAKDGRIITTGYNGAPAGLDHCDHRSDDTAGVTGCQTAEHAERNAIAYAARHGVGTDQSTLYSTHGPCLDCARSIINSGIVRVVYQTPYRKTEGVNLLIRAGVKVVHLPA